MQQFFYLISFNFYIISTLLKKMFPYQNYLQNLSLGYKRKTVICSRKDGNFALRSIHIKWNELLYIFLK